MVEDYSILTVQTQNHLFSHKSKILKNEKVYQIYNPAIICVCSNTDLADGINVDPNALSVSDAQAKTFSISIVANQYFQTVRNTMLWLDQGTELTDNTFL
jgi:hypothetical protein